jgi:hypothetical protein
MKYLLLTSIIALTACAQHVDRVYECPIQVGNKIIEGNCEDGNGVPSGVLDGGSQPDSPKDDPKEPVKDKPKDKDHDHGKGHFGGGFHNGKGKGWEDYKDW